MNKVVNINLNGFIFTIDEQAYDKLKVYIDGLRKHFAATPGAAEIISDIEARIAEVLQQKITDRYRIVQLNDVEAVIALMGNPSEIDGDDKTSVTDDAAKEASRQVPDKLRRDPRAKIISGVCAGIGNYFKIDPIIPRAVFMASFFVFGSGIFIYLLLWVVMPEASPAELPDHSNRNNKRLYRDKDQRMFGGVCSGLASYMGIDAVWLRITFLVMFFAVGTGFLLYLILWIIIPAAQTAAEKLQMKGEPVDVSSIERKVRETFKGSNEQIKKGAETAVRGVSALAQVMGSIIKLFGKFLGLLLVLMGILLGLLLFAFIFNGAEAAELKTLVKLFTGEGTLYLISCWAIAIFVFSVCLSLILLGVRLLFNLRYKLRAFAIAFGLVDLVCVVLLFFATGAFINSIKEEQTLTQHVSTLVCPDTLYLSGKESDLVATADDIRISYHGEEVFDINKVENGLWISATSLVIKQAKDDSISSYVVKTAHGENEEEAAELARMVNYSFQQTDSSITLNPKLFVQGQKYQFQHIQVKLRIPVGTIIKVDNYVLAMMNRSENKKQYYYHGTTFLMTNNGLQCLDCKDEPEESDDTIEIDVTDTETEAVDDIDVQIAIENNDSMEQVSDSMFTYEAKLGDLHIRFKKNKNR